MRYPFRVILLFAFAGLLGGCGSDETDHGHPHEVEADHAHTPAESAGGEDADHGHPHGEDTHSHDAPETEVFYGDEATEPAEAGTSDEGAHAHGDDTHTQTADEEDHAHEEEEPDEPHDHDH